MDNNIIVRMMRRRGITQKDMAKAMQISRPTLTKYVKCPLAMDGYYRQRFAEVIGIRIEIMDFVINHKTPFNAKTLNEIMESINPKTKNS